MTFYFFREDLTALEEQIKKLDTQRREWGKVMGEATRQSAETFHDNFPFEDANRQFEMLSVRIHDLMAIKSCARLVDGSVARTDRVSIGSLVTVEDKETRELRQIRIGSYMVLTERGMDPVLTVSYSSPMAKLIMGARVGDVRQGKVGETMRQLQVERIE